MTPSVLIHFRVTWKIVPHDLFSEKWHKLRCYVRQLVNNKSSSAGINRINYVVTFDISLIISLPRQGISLVAWQQIEL